MDVVLDTSILFKDPPLKGTSIELLVDYLAKTNSKVVLPSIVVEEAKGLYRRELEKRLMEYRKAHNQLHGIPTTVQLSTIPSIDLEKQVEHYITHVHSQLRTTPAEVVPYKNDYLPEIVARAIHRKKPIDKKGQQFRDALLWLTVLDYAATQKDRILAFVSANTTDFSNGQNAEEAQLASELREEADAKGITISYFSSLEEFIKAHASRVDFVTEEWVGKNFDLARVEESIIPLIEGSAIDRLTDDLMLFGHDRRLGPFEGTGTSQSRIQEYYVYEKQDGSLILNVEVVTEVEYAVTIERERDHGRTGWDYAPAMLPGGEIDMNMTLVPEYLIERNHRREYRYVAVRVQVTTSIADGALKDYEVIDWDWD